MDRGWAGCVPHVPLGAPGVRLRPQLPAPPAAPAPRPAVQALADLRAKAAAGDNGAAGKVPTVERELSEKESALKGERGGGGGGQALGGSARAGHTVLEAAAHTPLDLIASARHPRPACSRPGRPRWRGVAAVRAAEGCAGAGAHPVHQHRKCPGGRGRRHDQRPPEHHRVPCRRRGLHRPRVGAAGGGRGGQAGARVGACGRHQRHVRGATRQLRPAER